MILLEITGERHLQVTELSFDVRCRNLYYPVPYWAPVYIRDALEGVGKV